MPPLASRAGARSQRRSIWPIRKSRSWCRARAIGAPARDYRWRRMRSCRRRAPETSGCSAVRWRTCQRANIAPPRRPSPRRSASRSPACRGASFARVPRRCGSFTRVGATMRRDVCCCSTARLSPTIKLSSLWPSPRRGRSACWAWCKPRPKSKHRRIQSVVATPGYATDFRCSFRASAGVFHPNVLRGLLLKASATA